MKNPAIYEHLLGKLAHVYEHGPSPEFREFTIPTSVYLDPGRFEDERELLRSLPTPVAHVSQLEALGSCLVHDALGVPILVARNREGALSAMLNVCRHRGTRLLEDAGFCRVKKGFRCAYHGWTYDTSGRLTHVTREELFPTLDKTELTLKKLPVTERFGLVWVVGTPVEDYDFDAFLDPLEPDLAPLSLDNHVVFRRGTTTAQTNWKVVMEAFLDGYHVRHLHKRTVGRYFEDHQSFSEPAGPHVRAIVGRGGFRDAIARGAVDDIRDVATQNGVFKGEDLWVCEQIQRGLRSGANDRFTYGGEEAPIEWWHAELDRRIAKMNRS